MCCQSWPKAISKNSGFPLGDRKRLIKAIRAIGGPPSALITSEVGEIASSGRPAVVAAERRHLTVMICDLVGSTALSARLDPEDMSAVIDAFQATCARITLAFDGFLADVRGDGMLAYFGYPRAHEDEAERTVRAALDIAAAIAGLKTRAEEPLSVRIAVATGLVVVGGASALREQTVVGDIPSSRRAFRRSPTPERSSSLLPHAGCSAIGSVCATLASTSSRVSVSRSRRGRLTACRFPRAASTRSTPRV